MIVYLHEDGSFSKEKLSDEDIAYINPPSEKLRKKWLREAEALKLIKKETKTLEEINRKEDYRMMEL